MLFVESLSSLVWYMGSTFLPINLMWPCHKLDSTPVGLNLTTVTPHGASWLASSMCWPWCVVPSGFNLTGPHKLLLPRTPLYHTVDVPYGRWCHQIPIVPVVWTPFIDNKLCRIYSYFLSQVGARTLCPTRCPKRQLCHWPEPSDRRRYWRNMGSRFSVSVLHSQRQIL